MALESPHLTQIQCDAMDLPHGLHRTTPSELKARIEAERRGRPFLVFRDGGGAQRIQDLDDVPERLTIGRSPEREVALTWDNEVSRLHATIEHVGDEWTLVDDGRSHNGSFIDGARVHGRRRLRDGDAISLGQTTIVFRSPTGHESLQTATSQMHSAPVISDAQRRVLLALCRPFADKSYAIPASNRQIAEELVLGVETVKTHMRALFEAFGLGELPQHHKRAALAQRALETGLISPQDLAG